MFFTANTVLTTEFDYAAHFAEPQNRSKLVPNSIDPRILFAAERTLLAWNRTSIALIAFGFIVERSGLLLMVLMPEQVSSFSLQSTLWTGLGFILLGVFSALYSTKQYSGLLTVLDPSDIPQGYNPKWAMVVNGIIALLGLLLIIALYVGH